MALGRDKDRLMNFLMSFGLKQNSSCKDQFHRVQRWNSHAKDRVRTASGRRNSGDEGAGLKAPRERLIPRAAGAGAAAGAAE
jgi:hypothetical protein